MLRPIQNQAKFLVNLAIHGLLNPEKARKLRKQRRARIDIQRSGLFDEDWYRANNYDIHLSKVDPLHHFMTHGMGERRDPSPDFDTEFYVKQCPDWAERSSTPFEHYLAIGRQQGLRTKGLPSYERWVSLYDDLTAADLSAIEAEAARDGTATIDVVCLAGSPDDPGSEPAWDALATQVGIRIRTLTVGGSALPWNAILAERGLPVATGGERDDGAAAAPLPTLVLGPGVQLRPHACWTFLRSLEEKGALAAYSDHDVLTVEGRRSDPVFKPAMSPEYLANVDYVGPVALFRQAPPADRGSGNPDLLRKWLLAVEPSRVERVPFALYHVRDGFQAPRTTSLPAGAGEGTALPSVDIVIPTRDRAGLLRDCIDSILAKTDYPPDRLAITVVDNDSAEAATAAYFAELAAEPRIRIVRSPGRFNFSRINNDAARDATADILVFLNNDTTVLEPAWIRRLTRYAARPEIGAVGCKLLYPDGTIQHGGVALGVQGVGAHYLVGRDPAELGALEATREMTSLTGACLAVRRQAFAEAGGFDEGLEVAFNDVALCGTLARRGLRNIYVAEPLLLHHESKSRGFDDTPRKSQKQAREAIYARTRFADLFRDDPTYSPNKSLFRIDEPGFPPRVVRPWRRSTAGARRILFLSRTHQWGNGVPVVLAQQAAFFRDRGWDVTVAGPTSRHDFAYPGCRRVDLVSAAEASSYAVEHAVDCVVVHTPPFFSCTRFLGPRLPVYFVDHGEPAPDFFTTGRAEREAIDWEKRFSAPLAHRVFAISQTIWAQQFRSDAIVLRNGNSHLALWSRDAEQRRARCRDRNGLEGTFLVLNVCRFAEDTRQYKGVDFYARVATEFPFLFPDLKDRVVFAIAGRGEPEDVAFLESEGLQVHQNLTDEELLDLYAAADLYMNFSRWEGYNLGIGQALAMGLPAIASSIPAHREFPIFTADEILPVCLRLAAYVRGDIPAAREPFVESWEEPLARMESIVSADVSEMQSQWY